MRVFAARLEWPGIRAWIIGAVGRRIVIALRVRLGRETDKGNKRTDQNGDSRHDIPPGFYR